MAEKFSEAEWAKVGQTLAGNESNYGLPERRPHSVVFASWNIRKFGELAPGGKPSNSDGAYAMIARFCKRCDLISIQETQTSRESVHRLRDDLNKGTPGAPYKLLLTDVTGVGSDGKGLAERMCFVYDSRRVEVQEIVTDVSLDLSVVVDKVNDALRQVRDEMVKQSPNDLLGRLSAWFNQALPFKQVGLKSFLQFIRAPYLATFRIAGEDSEAYDIACVNAHLWWGNAGQREREFFVLLDWMARRSAEPLTKADAPVLMLMGDLNLDFSSSSDKRKKAIEEVIVKLNADKKKGEARVNFPFLDKHPKQSAPFLTNARQSETYDQIAWFGRDERFPRGRHNDLAGTLTDDDFDYGMFDFVRLFADAGVVKKKDGKLDTTRFEFDLSDHMPIWLRMPLPHKNQRTFTVPDA